MRSYLSLCVGVLAAVVLIAAGAQADGVVQSANVKFIWNIQIPGMPAIPLDNYTMQGGESFRWQDIGIRPEYQPLAGVYWTAMGNSSITVNQNAVNANITIVVTILPGGEQIFGYSIPIALEFEVYDGIADGNSVEGLCLLNPPGSHFDFACSDGLILYFDLSPQFEEVFLASLGLTREGLTLAFAGELGFTWEGITVSVSDNDGDGLIDGLTGEVAHLSKLVIVKEEAVTAVEPSSWAAIKTLYR
ncbi:MAG: hypothetical protein DRQ02_05955 [Candidatus Latescibacterota bacterium]|nr:MAG: hypothetical protein DRQ02_05955 [Candidatus Latescibacterota bacterium]RKY74079.1 MAG: hypothetical protein DRQ24_00625 [Candidatus Latescibacterota bacterium]